MSGFDCFERSIQTLLEQNPMGLSPLAAGVIAACKTGIVKDSRDISNKLGIEHALILRECILLEHEHDLVEISEKNERTQRVKIFLKDGAQELFR